MKITDEEQEKILNILQADLHGLSISEISRKSGVNRNKVSYILETLHQEELLICSQQYNSKVFALKHPSSIHTLLDYVPMPALVLDEQFRIIQMNLEYANLYPEDVPLVPGAELRDISHIPFQEIEDKLGSFLEEGCDGQQETYLDKSGIQICRAIRVNLLGDKPGVVLILPITKKDKSPDNDPFKTFLHLYSQNSDTIMGTKTLSDAYAHISSLVNTAFPDDFFFTLLVDESKQTGIIHTIHMPEEISKKNQQNVNDIISKSFPSQIPDLKILRFKTERTILIDNIPDIFQENPDLRSVKNILGSSQFPPFSATGIILHNSLIAIIGMGNSTNSAPLNEYSDILPEISAIFTAVGEVFQKKEEIQENWLKFQGDYSNVYALLTKKTRESTSHALESEQYRQILGAVLDKMGIMFLVTTQDEISYANQKTLDEYNLHEKNLINASGIDDVLPSDLTSLIRTLIREKGVIQKTPLSSSQFQIEKQGEVWQWYLSGYLENTYSDLFFFIGEKLPASFIHYLILHRPL